MGMPSLGLDHGGQIGLSRMSIRKFQIRRADYAILVTAEMTGSLCGNLVLKTKTL